MVASGLRLLALLVRRRVLALDLVGVRIGHYICILAEVAMEQRALLVNAWQLADCLRVRAEYAR